MKELVIYDKDWNELTKLYNLGKLTIRRRLMAKGSMDVTLPFEGNDLDDEIIRKMNRVKLFKTPDNLTEITETVSDGGCFTGDGIDDYAESQSSVFGGSNVTTATISFWGYFEDFLQNHNLFFRAFGLSLYPRMSYILSSDRLEVQYRIDGVTKSFTVNNFSTLFNVQTWYLFTVTFDNTVGVRLYINGVFQAQNTDTGTIFNGGVNALRLGYDSGTVRYLKGRIDDFRMYDEVLSDTEIESIYNNGEGANIPRTDTRLKVAYDFNEESGTNADDKSGNNNHLDFFNGAQWDKGKVPVTETIITPIGERESTLIFTGYITNIAAGLTSVDLICGDMLDFASETSLENSYNNSNRQINTYVETVLNAINVAEDTGVSIGLNSITDIVGIEFTTNDDFLSFLQELGKYRDVEFEIDDRTLNVVKQVGEDKTRTVFLEYDYENAMSSDIEDFTIIDDIDNYANYLIIRGKNATEVVQDASEVAIFGRVKKQFTQKRVYDSAQLIDYGNGLLEKTTQNVKLGKLKISRVLIDDIDIGDTIRVQINGGNVLNTLVGDVRVGGIDFIYEDTFEETEIYLSDNLNIDSNVFDKLLKLVKRVENVERSL